MALLILLHKYIAPAGMRMLWMLAIMLLALSVFLLVRQYRRYRANPLRIRKRMWYSGGLKMSVQVRNISCSVVEIDAPVVEFHQPHMGKRRFKIVSPGDMSLFPLGLPPQTSYDFIVEFTRLYDREEILRRYKRVVILVKNRKGKPITRKKVKIRMPK